MSAAKNTIDHREIQRWVERHGGHPAAVRRTRGKGEIGMLRIDFPGFSGEGTLEPIPWEEWFRKFDDQQLAFLYQDGKNTNFNKLVRRDPDQVRPSDRRRGMSRTTRGGRAAARALGAERATSRGSTTRSASSRRGAAQRAMNGMKKPRTPARTTRAGTRRSARPTPEMTKSELYALARSAGVANRSRMSKSELLRALERQRP